MTRPFSTLKRSLKAVIFVNFYLNFVSKIVENVQAPGQD